MRPVFGITDCGMLTAVAQAGCFGVIAISQRSIVRHMRYLLQNPKEKEGAELVVIGCAPSSTAWKKRWASR